MTEFKDGDLVLLNSGGPLMTVENTRTDHMVSVRWFVGDEHRWEAFRPECLVLVSVASETA